MATKDKQLFIFDFGNVIVENIICNPAIARELGVDYETFEEEYGWYVIPLMDGTIGTRAYWEHVSSRFGVKIEEELFYKHFHPVAIETTLKLVKALREAGKRVVGGTNTYAPHYQKLTEMGIPPLFDKVYTSHDMGISKPSESFFRRIIEKEGFTVEETFFIDDYKVNTDRASKLGIESLQYAGEDRDEKLRQAFSWLEF